MFKELAIDWYPDGYHSSTYVNCIDICIAAATGYFKYDYYYLYCFCWSLKKLWDFRDTASQEVLDLLSLKLNTYKPDNKKDFIERVKSCLDKNVYTDLSIPPARSNCTALPLI